MCTAATLVQVLAFHGFVNLKRISGGLLHPHTDACTHSIYRYLYICLYMHTFHIHAPSRVQVLAFYGFVNFNWSAVGSVVVRRLDINQDG